MFNPNGIKYINLKETSEIMKSDQLIYLIINTDIMKSDKFIFLKETSEKMKSDQ